uniref:Translin-associated factor X-interacting protein 1 N-terminal domain-containing protein n=1 Tax=Palpitomonas bilix TaxID=652834 RepID=A0A7S3G9G2_9EUKA|mmetsp:Transcript_41297/g.106863  ORF Transcript_41297/g.106863 Transcript_41297/m.106863 type:complete len:859 (+) Transcript_41297:223-2799(+)
MPRFGLAPLPKIEYHLGRARTDTQEFRGSATARRSRASRPASVTKNAQTASASESARRPRPPSFPLSAREDRLPFSFESDYVAVAKDVDVLRRQMMVEWKEQLDQEEQNFHSIGIFLEKKLNDMLASTEKYGKLNHLRVLAVCDILDRVFASLPRYGSLLGVLKHELLRAIFDRYDEVVVRDGRPLSSCVPFFALSRFHRSDDDVDESMSLEEEIYHLKKQLDNSKNILSKQKQSLDKVFARAGGRSLGMAFRAWAETIKGKSRMQRSLGRVLKNLRGTQSKTDLRRAFRGWAQVTEATKWERHLEEDYKSADEARSNLTLRLQDFAEQRDAAIRDEQIARRENELLKHEITHLRTQMARMKEVDNADDRPVTPRPDWDARATEFKEIPHAVEKKAQDSSMSDIEDNGGEADDSGNGAEKAKAKSDRDKVYSKFKRALAQERMISIEHALADDPSKGATTTGDKVKILYDEVKRLRVALVDAAKLSIVFDYTEESSPISNWQSKYKDTSKHFNALGTGNDVPPYLRIKGRVKKRHVTKRECEKMVKDVWRQKAESKDEDNLSQFFFKYLKGRFGMQTMVADWGYNMLYALKKYSYDADCELFLKILIGELDEDVYIEQMSMLDRVSDAFRKADLSDGGSVTGLLSRFDIERVLREQFPLKSNEQFEEIIESMQQDQPGEGMVKYAALFEEDREGNQGEFAECIRDQFIQEREDYLKELEECLIAHARLNGGNLSRVLVVEAFKDADADKPREEVDKIIEKIFKGVSGEVIPSEKLMKLLWPQYIARSGRRKAEGSKEKKREVSQEMKKVVESVGLRYPNTPEVAQKKVLAETSNGATADGVEVDDVTDMAAELFQMRK